MGIKKPPGQWSKKVRIDDLSLDSFSLFTLLVSLDYFKGCHLKVVILSCNNICNFSLKNKNQLPKNRNFFKKKSYFFVKNKPGCKQSLSFPAIETLLTSIYKIYTIFC